jgi:hypothetical protein
MSGQLVSVVMVSVPSIANGAMLSLTGTLSWLTALLAVLTVIAGAFAAIVYGTVRTQSTHIDALEGRQKFLEDRVAELTTELAAESTARQAAEQLATRETQWRETLQATSLMQQAISKIEASVARFQREAHEQWAKQERTLSEARDRRLQELAATQRIADILERKHPRP